MRSASRPLVIAALVCLGFRALFVLLPSTPLRTKVVESISDGVEYDRLASNLARHQVFSRDSVPPYRPELSRTPVYPAFLVPAHLLPGSPLLWAVLLQTLLSLAVVWLTLRFAIEAGLERRAGALAALLVGLSPNLAFVATKLATETLFSLVLLASLVLLNRYRRTGRLPDLVGSGVAAGLMILTRPIATYFPLLVAAYCAWLWLRNRSSYRWWSALVPVACAAIVVTPWVVRNHAASGRYVVSTISDRSIYLYTAATVLASERRTTLDVARDSMLAEAQRRFGPLDTADEATLWPALSRVAQAHLVRRPLPFAKVMLAGFAGNYIIPISVGPLLVHSGAAEAVAARSHVMQNALGALLKGRVAEALRAAWQTRIVALPPFARGALLVALLFNVVLMALVVFSLVAGRTRGLYWLLLPVLYFTLLTGPVGEARFRAPIEPLLCLVAAAALVSRGRPAQRQAGQA
jgi:hypothetical protein